MEKVVEAFVNLVDAFRRSPVSFLIVLMLTVGGYLIYTQNSYMLSLLPNPEKENLQFELSLKRDLTINTALGNSLEYLQAKNLSINQFHNGQYDLTRLPFTKISVTYFAGESNLTSTELYSPRPLSTMNYLMLEMWKDKENPQCTAAPSSEIRDTDYKLRLEESGAKFVSLCPITNVLNYPIGYMAITYNHVPSESEIPGLIQYQKLMTARIAGYLQEGVVHHGS